MFEAFLQKYGIETVAERTKISKRNLMKLARGDFEQMTYAQAIGFTKILSREFHEDLTPLKESIETFFADRVETASEPIFHLSQEPQKPRRWSLWIGVALVVGGALFSYRLLQTPNQQTLKAQVSTSTLPVSDASCEPSNTTTHKLHDLDGVADQKHTPLATSTKETSKVAATQASDETNTTQWDQQEGGMQAFRGESWKRSVQPLRQTGAQPAESIPSSPPKAPRTTSSDHVVDQAALGQTIDHEAPDQRSSTREAALLEPEMRLWIGLIDLKTHKRRAKTIASAMTITLKEGLLIVGHGRLKLIDRTGKMIAPNDLKRHFFHIVDGTIEEIDQESFKQYNGGKVW